MRQNQELLILIYHLVLIHASILLIHQSLHLCQNTQMYVMYKLNQLYYLQMVDLQYYDCEYEDNHCINMGPILTKIFFTTT